MLATSRRFSWTKTKTFCALSSWCVTLEHAGQLERALKANSVCAALPDSAISSSFSSEHSILSYFWFLRRNCQTTGGSEENRGSYSSLLKGTCGSGARQCASLAGAMEAIGGSNANGASANGASTDAPKYDYDLIVIGGGSGGLACSKEAAKYGKKVALFDYVQPSPQGTSWGLGGTCVNVGCIPKKLMHQAAQLGPLMHDAVEFGWKLKFEGHDWEKLVTGVQDYIRSLNWGYRVALRDAKVTYINQLARFVDPHTVEGVDRKGQKKLYTAEYFVIAVGGRPKYPNIPGDREHCITSDDIFGLPKPPGKTLCVGASYIALECAGFLTELGYDTSIMGRSIFLRGFDQEVAAQIGGYMERHGTRMIKPAVPTKFEKTEDGKVLVTYKNTDFGFEMTDTYDTVVLAIGREAETAKLGLENAGIIYDKSSGKIPAINERTNVPNIYAIGDVVMGHLELTPVAIKAGILLAKRLFGGGKQLFMDYQKVPTTVFTPLEYGSCGMSQEVAAGTYGEANLEVYISYVKPLEWQINHEQVNGVMMREDNVCFAKLICNKLDDERVVGFHYLGPNAGEVTQGFAVALKCNAKKADFDATVGIHPTMAEEFTTMKVTKRSGANPKKSGC